MDTSRKKYDFVYNFIAAGKNITEVINVKERGNQLFKDKFVLVMLVLGLLTIVAAAGAVRIQKGRENIGESPYLEIEDPDHVTEQAFTGYEVTADGITVTLPACSVTEIRVK